MRSWVLSLLAFSYLLIGANSFAQELPVPVPVPDGFRANRTSYSAIMDVLDSQRTTVTQAQLDQLKTLQIEKIWGALGDYKVNYVRGFTSTQPGTRLVGRALTMRFLPQRPDFVDAIDTLAKEGDWDRRYYARAAEEAQPSDVIVADLGGNDGHNLFGDMGALGIKLRGASGVVIDGGSRDLRELQGDDFADFPVFARFFDVHTTSWLGADWNTPIRFGTVTVLPGDIVVAEEEGILFFPAHLVETILEQAAAGDLAEDYQRELLRSRDHRFRDVYPLSPELRQQYERRSRTPPDP